jgi:molecular chaperone DnaJ
MVDYYMVLGVDPGANLSQIRRAFRELSHRHDPDHSGEAEAGPFMQIQEAYNALSDDSQRAQHEQDRAAPEASATPMRAERMNLFGMFDAFEPSREEIWQRWRKNFDSRHEGKTKTARELNVEVVISAEEARRPGSLAIEVPIGTLCEDCGGSGVSGYFDCDTCEGHGMLWEMRQLDVLLRPPVRDGMVVAVSLAHLGVNNLNLRVHVRVAQ